MKKVLIVDNNRTIVEMLASGLSQAGYEPVKAYDGMEALDRLKQQVPDMIVLDLIMPKIDGYRLAKYLKNTADYRHIPIIVLTGIAAEDPRHMSEVEADAFIAKGKMENTLSHVLTTLKWLETRKKIPMGEIRGAGDLFPREMTRELLLVKEHFDSMLQVMGEGVMEMDEQNRIFFANQAAAQLLGISEIELFGRGITEVFPDVPGLGDYLDKLPSQKKTGGPGLHIQLKDRTVRLLAAPFFYNQAYIGSIAVLEDITARVRKEMALEELTSSIIQSAPIGIGLLDGDQRIILSNRHFRNLSHAKGELGPQTFTDLPAFHGAPFVELARRAIASAPGTITREEITFTFRGGRKARTYNVTATPLHRQNMRTFLLLLVEDVSERALLQRELMAANRELETANRAKSNFLSIVSHELRTPLSVIRGYVSLILEGKIPGAGGEALDALKTTDKRARHLQQLIEELLDVSRIEAGKITLKEEILSLSPHIKETVETLRDEIRKKNLTLVTDLPPDLPEVVADHDKVHQVFGNLVNNAVKFTPEGGEIAIRGEAAEGGVTVSVKDSGIGIPDDKIPLIFNKFYQVDSTDTRVYGGAGLGLSIVRMILEAMGGRISVTSKSGSGSTFTVFLPLGSRGKPRKEHAPEAEKTAPEAAPESRLEKKTVLLCEDDEDTVKIIGYALPPPDYELVVCRNGFQALEKVFTRAVDLAIVDMRLPFMNGYELCRILKANESTSGIPVIILSAAGREEEIRAGYEAGAEEYIIKPFSLKDLQEKVKRHLR